MTTASEHPVFKYARFDIECLCQLASSLRIGVVCTCDIDQKPASGSFNWAVFITFKDGIQWVLRSPYTRGAALPSEISSKLLASEVATLRYLKKYSDIPVPEVFSYSPTHQNGIGIPYILMSKATGWPLERAWKTTGSDELAAHRKAKVLSQLGTINFKLSQLRFDKIGSLQEQNGSWLVQECLSRGHILHNRYMLEDVPRGPFVSEMGFFDSLLGGLIEQAEVLPLSPHCFVAPIPRRDEFQSDDQHKKACDLWNDFITVGSKIDSTDNRLDYMIVGHTLREMISESKLKLPTRDPNSFPLCHPDLSVNNIYVDADCNITCIIDWAFTSSVPEAMVLVPPGLPQSRNELSTDLISAFETGFATNTPATGRMDETTLALLEQSRCCWPLTRLLYFDSTDDYRLFLNVWREVYSADSEEKMKRYFADQRSSSRYEQCYKEMQTDDEPPQKTRDKERDYFQDDMFRLSVARKLTVVSQWRSQYTPSHRRFRNGSMFVAESRLWKWIIDFIEEWKNLP